MWQLPVTGRVTSPFGMRVHPVTGVYKLHTGTDFAAATGTPIHAASVGVVRSAGYLTGDGNSVIIDHGDGISTLYGHASELDAKPGDRVQAGQVIAKAGATGYATGPHLTSGSERTTSLRTRCPGCGRTASPSSTRRARPVPPTAGVAPASASRTVSQRRAVPASG